MKLNFLIIILILAISCFAETDEHSLAYKFDSTTYYSRAEKALSSPNRTLELRFLRNEIFAHHGRTFSSVDLQNYFHNKEWYKPSDSYSDSLISKAETKFIKWVLNLEAKEQGEIDYQFFLNIDSSYIVNFKLPDGDDVKSLKNPVFGKNDESNSLIKTKAVYRVVEEFKVNKIITAKILTPYFPEIVLDGGDKILFLATYKMNEEVDAIRLAKFETLSDVYELETAVIKENSVNIIRYYKTIGFDETTTEFYQISDNGKFKLKK